MLFNCFFSVMWKVGRRNMTSLLILDNTTEYTIGGLTPFTEYSFYVFSYTAAGKGNFPARLTAKTASSSKSVCVFVHTLLQFE